MADDAAFNNPTIPSRRGLGRSGEAQNAPQRDLLQKAPPLVLQQYFNGEVNLERELASRYPAMPLMSLSSFRTTGLNPRRGVALLATQDGAASLRVEVNGETRAVSFVFAIGSMLGLGFSPLRLSDLDRGQWLDAMRAQEAASFLWGQARWEQDYVIATPGRHFYSFYAFSNHGHEAAARVTTEITGKLLDWLDQMWR